jgi:DNA-binding HxlR family transcriptional regulator
VTAPLPGTEVRGSRTGRPIMALLDLIGRRWSLRVIWELRAEPGTFRALQSRCDDLSPTVLNTRLRELRAAGILDHGAEGYRLTEQGKALILALAPLHDWADGWAKALPSPAAAPE